MVRWVLGSPDQQTLKDRPSRRIFRRTASDLSYMAKDMRNAMTQLPEITAHLKRQLAPYRRLAGRKG